MGMDMNFKNYQSRTTVLSPLKTTGKGRTVSPSRQAGDGAILPVLYVSLGFLAVLLSAFAWNGGFDFKPMLRKIVKIQGKVEEAKAKKEVKKHKKAISKLLS